MAIYLTLIIRIATTHFLCILFFPQLFFKKNTTNLAIVIFSRDIYTFQANSSLFLFDISEKKQILVFFNLFASVLTNVKLQAADAKKTT